MRIVKLKDANDSIASMVQVTIVNKSSEELSREKHKKTICTNAYTHAHTHTYEISKEKAV